jgi:hypothetical protein
MSTSIKAMLDQLTKRLDAIENMIGHNRGPPLDDEQEDRRLSKRQLAERWNVSTRKVDRGREEDPEFPPAERDREGGPVFFWMSDIVRYEKQRAARTQRLPHTERRTMRAARSALALRRSP